MKKIFFFLFYAIFFASCNCSKNNNETDSNMIREQNFSTINPEEIPSNIIKMINKEWMLITAGNDSAYNTMTASWGALGELWSKPVAFCFIRPQRFTYKFMEREEYYTLCFFDSVYHSALEFCGSKSGRDFQDKNKAEVAGLTPTFTGNGTPYFQEAYLVLVCKKIYSQQFQKEYFVNNDIIDPNEKLYPSLDELHKMYVGEIVSVMYKKIISEK